MASERKLSNDDIVQIGTSPTFEPFLCEVSHNFDATSEEIDATCKSDSAKFLLAGKPSYTFSVTAELDQENTTGAYTYQDAVADFVAGTVRDFQVGTSTVGDTIFTGTCVVSGFSKSSELDDVPTVTFNFNVRTLSTSVNT